MNTIVLQAQTPAFHFGDNVPEGLIIERHEMEHEGSKYHYNTYRFPEAGAARYFTHRQLAEGLVVPIAGRRWRLAVTVQDEDGYGIPEEATVVFVPTEEPETEGQHWDEAAKLKEIRTAAECRIAQIRAQLDADAGASGEQRTWLEKGIADEEQQIARIDSGELQLSPNHYAQVFGQPQFIQNEVFPVVDGRCAMHLLTLETGWGDCGNVNLLFHVDENGVPCALWFEASCA